jgi:hypothetical protein
MLDKVILVHYVNVGNMSAPKAREAVASYINAYKNVDDRILNYYIADKVNKIECIYPVSGSAAGTALSAALSAALVPFVDESNTPDTRLKISKVIDSVLLAFGVKFTDVYIEEENI